MAEAERRVTSLADFSTQLLEAFAESNGEHRALVFVDDSADAFEIDDISYDERHKCIRVQLSGAYVDIGAPSIQEQIQKANNIE